MYFLLHQEKINITAVCDLYEDRCDDAAKKVEENGMKAPFKTTDYKEVLKRDDVEAVVIVTPWAIHIEIAIGAMKAGKITIMEVGGAYSVDERFGSF